MGKISREELKVGDHIYTWRTGYIYAHHGIYVGEDTVIHFTRRAPSFLKKIMVSSTSKEHKNPCLKCGNRSKLNSNSKSRVAASCLDCFLEGRKLYLFKYNVSWTGFIVRVRGGTCTTAISDSPEEVVHRANYLWEQNGFGDYNLFKNNCEDFAIYCKTSLVVTDEKVVGGSGQISSAAGFILVFGGFTLNTVIRLHNDVGVRKDVVKVPVENLVLRMKSEMTSEMKSEDVM